MFYQAIKNLNSSLSYGSISEITNKTDYDDIPWIVGEDDNGIGIVGVPDNLPSWEEVQAEITRLQTEYDSKEYSRKRKEEYPSIEECVHAILDDELEALQIKRQIVKDKYPKE